jgi:uncharacterized protein DUF4082
VDRQPPEPGPPVAARRAAVLPAYDSLLVADTGEVPVLLGGSVEPGTAPFPPTPAPGLRSPLGDEPPTLRPRKRSRRRRIGLVAGLLTPLLALGAWAFTRPTHHAQLSSSPSKHQPGVRPGPGGARGVEAGEHFTLNADGRLTAVKFLPSGRHSSGALVHVWSGNGTLLATASPSRGSSRRAAGWRTATLPKPLAMTKGTQFVVSFWAPDTRTPPAPTPQPLKRTAPVTAGALGYHAGSGFPDVAGPQGDYPIDLAFTPAAAPKPAPSAAPSAGGPGPQPGPGGSSQSSNCAPAPSKCGFPDASNTGPRKSASALAAVPGKVTGGKGWHYDSRGWIEVDGNGAVLDGLNLSHGIDITASDVTIRNVRVSETGESFGIGLRHTKNVTIEDSDIFSPQTGSGRLMVAIKDIYSDSSGLKILRNDMWNTSTAVEIDAGLVQDNYIHDLALTGGDHINGTTSNASDGSTLTLRHNTVLNKYQQTDAISLFEDFGVQANRVIDDNLMAGGGYTLYGGANPGGAATSNIKITNNRFSKLYFPHGGYFGPVTAFDQHGSGNVWSGNVWDDSGAPVNP